MRKLLLEKDKVFHLQEHAVWKNDDGSYNYMSWDSKPEKLTWVSGIAIVVENLLCLTVPQSEGEEESMQSIQEVEFELNKLPNWDKTKYYCVLVLGGSIAALIKHCDTGEPLEAGEKDYISLERLLEKFGTTLS